MKLSSPSSIGFIERHMIEINIFLCKILFLYIILLHELVNRKQYYKDEIRKYKNNFKVLTKHINKVIQTKHCEKSKCNTNCAYSYGRCWCLSQMGLCSIIIICINNLMFIYSVYKLPNDLNEMNVRVLSIGHSYYDLSFGITNIMLSTKYFIGLFLITTMLPACTIREMNVIESNM